MAKISTRLSKAAEQWHTLQAGVNAKAAKALKDAGASLSVPPEQWPPDTLRTMAAVGWTVEKALEILERAAHDERVIKIVWTDNIAALQEQEPVLLHIAPGLIDKLMWDGEEEQEPAAEPAAPPARQPAALPEPPPAQQPPAAPAEPWEVRKARFQREMREKERRERQRYHPLSGLRKQQQDERNKRA